MIQADFLKHFLLVFMVLWPFDTALAESFAPTSTQEQSYQYIVLGDSISAGLLGFSQVGEEPSEVEGQGDGFLEPPPPKKWWGIRYPWFIESKQGWSWATGRQTRSIATRLQRWLGHQGQSVRLHRMNLAESGGLAEHMPRQARLAVDEAWKRRSDPVELVTIMIGANDACQSVESTSEEAERMHYSLATTFRRLAEGASFASSEPLKVFVSSIPNIPELGNPEFLNHRAFLGLTCADIRKSYVNVCPLLLEWSTPEEYQARVERVTFINQVLQSAVLEAQAKHSNLSLHFDWSLAEARQRPGLLAADCFHPGRYGQTQLAQRMWEAMPWYSSLASLP